MPSLVTNLSALAVQRRLGDTTSRLSQSFERLSSGLRIGSAADDAAGLAISESLRADSRVYSQGVRNLNDGISVTNIAESTLDELTNIVTRIRELAQQSANGTLSNAQRGSIDAEAQALSKEYFRISRVATFNGLRLFDGSTQGLRVQGGYGESGGIAASLGGQLGTGTLSGTATIAGVETADWNFAMEYADINSDGISDLIQGGRIGTQAIITVQNGRGDGAFSGAVSYMLADNMEGALVLGDLNGDGKLDVVTSGYMTGGTGGNANVLINKGDGTFYGPVSYQTATQASFGGLSLADINGDGILDMGVGARSGGTGWASIRLGIGDGTFGAATSYATEGGYSLALNFGDVNGDSVLDLVTAGYTGTDGYSTIRLGRGDGTFGSALSYATEAKVSYAMALTDLNGDGILDMATVGASDAIDGYLTLRMGRGDGTFGQAISVYTDARMEREIAVGDFNGDGVKDLIVGGMSEFSYHAYVHTLIGNGDGTFQTQTSQELFLTSGGNTWVGSLVVTDFNGDGVQDVLAGGAQNTGAQHAIVQVLLGETRDGVSPLLPFSLKRRSEALQAIPMLESALRRVSLQRGQVGAVQSRLGTAVANMQVAGENYDAARSTITDVDVAQESAYMLKTQITQRAAGAILAQANSAPQLALQLLKRG